MRFLRALISRSLLGVVFVSVTAFGIGFGSYSVVNAADSWVDPWLEAQNAPNPIQHTWTGAAGSGVITTSGPVWVTGSGDMKWPVETQNDWVTAYYDELMVCTIDCEPPRAKWKIDAQCYLWIRAYGEGVNEIGWDDNCRAETTGTVEMWGAFSAFTENQVIVDNYTGATNGWLKYDTVGGGVPPIKYPGGGLYKIKDTPNTNQTAAGVDVAGERAGKLLSIWAYVRGKQYFHAQHQHAFDTELETEIGHYLVDDDGNPIHGWTGTLTSYYLEPSTGQWVQIHVHAIPTGIVQ